MVILYEMTIIYLEEAEQAYKKEDKEGFQSAVRRTRGCIRELISSLHSEYEPAGNLLQLYLYANRELTRANIRNSKEELAHVKGIMTKLHKAYQEIAVQDTSAPVMGNTQTVYAGLTYGKNSLTESLADQGSNRGFLA